MMQNSNAMSNEPQGGHTTTLQLNYNSSMNEGPNKVIKIRNFQQLFGENQMTPQTD